VGSALSFSAFIFYEWQLPEFNGIKAAPSQLYNYPVMPPFRAAIQSKAFRVPPDYADLYKQRFVRDHAHQFIRHKRGTRANTCQEKASHVVARRQVQGELILKTLIFPLQISEQCG
jgi:hypothetical protein